ncbi:gamma-glutamyltransferase [candidate division KSB1 bacterium]|nr:gamma-glutamyltransferase [candidate division KSB1 bacterium]
MKAMTRILWVAVALAGSAASLYAVSARPTWSKNSMVSSADGMATEVGVAVLRDGGNAIDAAVATALALGVTENYASGIGGGCFILLHTADGRDIAIDGREVAPAAATRLMFVPADTSAESDLSETGPLAAGVPGELAALNYVLTQFGTKSLSELLEPAIALADTGFIANGRYERNLGTQVERMRRFDATRRIFLTNESTGKKLGERIVQTDLAQTLRRIQTEGVDAFYRGEIASAIADYCAASGGIITRDDLREYEPKRLDPVRGRYHGLEVVAMPPPSSGGLHVIQILNLLEPLRIDTLGAGSAAAYHTIAEAFQIAFADRAEFLGDPRFTKVPSVGLASKDYAEQRRTEMPFARHVHLSGPGNPWAFDSTAEKHTTHLCVVDKFGNAVSLTATINTPFGSAAVVPGTGILLNNQMDDFVTRPGRPNYFGLVGNAANEVEPDKTPLSSMAPTLLLKNGKVFMAIGSQGGPRIITSVVMAIVNVIDYGMQLQAAVDVPRIHQQWLPDKLFVEPEVPRDVLVGLTNRGHVVDNSSRWSTVTAIMADTSRGGWWGAADNRAEGLARGE